MGVQCPREVLEKKQKAEPTGEELPSLGKHCKEGVTGFASEQRFLGRHIIQWRPCGGALRKILAQNFYALMKYLTSVKLHKYV